MLHVVVDGLNSYVTGRQLLVLSITSVSFTTAVVPLIEPIELTNFLENFKRIVYTICIETRLPNNYAISSSKFLPKMQKKKNI